MRGHIESLTLPKFPWVVHFISHGHPSSLEASFEIELDTLDFNNKQNQKENTILGLHNYEQSHFLLQSYLFQNIEVSSIKQCKPCIPCPAVLLVLDTSLSPISSPKHMTIK